MKKTLLSLTALLMLAACQQTADTSNASLNACLTAKAYAAVNDGSAFTTDIKTTAKNISTACIKQLALQKAGLSEEALTATTNLLTALKEAKNN
ncbi:MAG: hypothetical protein J6Y85_05065 [Alphaproteobacteria bacterium]|nr:hypothetical protein [Alphaproteobacteria bacterium]